MKPCKNIDVQSMLIFFFLITSVGFLKGLFYDETNAFPWKIPAKFNFYWNYFCCINLWSNFN